MYNSQDMKEFLFLYPISEYLDACIGRITRRESGWLLCKRFNDLVEARYRQRDFGVNWLMFSKSSEEPDKKTTRFTFGS